MIIALWSLPNPMAYVKIKELTSIPTSTANDIWRHAVENAEKARHEARQRVEKPIGLLELVEAKCLDPNPRQGMPEVFTEEDKDCLVETVKLNFASRRMKLIDIQPEAGLSHVGDGTVFCALASRGIHAYHEEFKPILGPEHRLNRLVSLILLGFYFVLGCRRAGIQKHPF